MSWCCPHCKGALQRKRGMGLKPIDPAPGDFSACRRCGAIVVVNLDLSRRLATRQEIEVELRLRPSFWALVKSAERTRREYAARKSGFATAAAAGRGVR